MHFNWRTSGLVAATLLALLSFGRPQECCATDEFAPVDQSEQASPAVDESEPDVVDTSVDEPIDSPANEEADIDESPANTEIAEESVDEPTDEPAKPITAEPGPVAEVERDARPISPTPTLAKDIAPALFNGVQPGTTTRAELESAWGPPLETIQEPPTVEYVYELEGFRRVSVSLEDGLVSSILIDLEVAQPPETLATVLDIARFDAVEVHDHFGEPLGLAFAERGVLFSFDPRSPSNRVAQVILERIDGQAFVLRAEENMRQHLAASLADVEYALSLDPKNPRAQWLQARVLTELGRYESAREAAETATRLAPNDPEYLLTLALIEGEMGDYEDAVEKTKQAIQRSMGRPEVNARALAQLGDQLAAGPQRDFKSAIDYHQQAIRAASTVVADSRVAVRREAKRVLLDAHLAAAADVAWGVWKRKQEVAEKWLARAKVLADDMVKNEDAGLEPRFLVVREALATSVGLDGAIAPEAWARQALQIGQVRIERTTDPLSQQIFQWELGLALYDAVQAHHTRGEQNEALQCAEIAVGYLERGSPLRQELPGYAYLMGRLYYRIGSIYAAEHQDHQRAVDWFERAVPLMEEPIPQSALADYGRQGETFVSMAISYWELGDHEEALRLTSQGVELIEQAVDEQILPPAALGVPYHNLAEMHRELGHEDEADDFARLAARHTDTEQR